MSDLKQALDSNELYFLCQDSTWHRATLPACNINGCTEYYPCERQLKLQAHRACVYNGNYAYNDSYEPIYSKSPWPHCRLAGPGSGMYWVPALFKK